LLAITVFIATAVVTMAVIRESLPLPPVPVVQQKLQHLAQHPDRYDTLFIGSSRVFFHVSPKVFDSVAAAHGLPTRSFNLGIEAMKVPENAFLWDEVAELDLRGLQRVFIEVTGFDDSLDDDAASWRDRYWHDWERTHLVVRELLSDRKARLRLDHLEQTLEIWGEAWSHLELFLVETASIGRGAEWMAHLEGAKPGNPSRALGPLGDGYRPNHDRLAPAHLEAFERELRERQTTDLRSRKMAGSGIVALRRMVDDVRAAGAEPYLFLAPVLDSKKFKVAELFPDVPVLDFHDVEEYPELFTAGDRFDPNHLNARERNASRDALRRSLSSGRREQAPYRSAEPRSAA
jgi:hypothetical protein